jgi:hypothetical protein
MKYLLLPAFLLSLTASSQNKLQPGFDPHEYASMLSLAFKSSGIPDSVERRTKKDPYHMEYRSPEVGLKNRWTLYLRNDNVAVIDLRGTVNQPASWLANVYAAMIPATGDLQINDSTVFHYQFAADSRALVHAGWTVSIAHLAPDVEEKINKYYRDNHVKEFFISGHSQGGALATLMRSLLEYEKQKGKIPADIVFKTYCSAAPKTGNMYYAYDFDFINRVGWAFTVVNAADWVPECPFSIQTLQDFNPTNPLIHAKDVIKKQKFAIRFAGNIVYSKLEKKPRKAQRKFEKYLGHTLYEKAVHKTLPQLKEPGYAHSNNYMRAGTPIILMPDEDYYKQFPQTSNNVFTHHMFTSYYYLLKKWYKLE